MTVTVRDLIRTDRPKHVSAFDLLGDWMDNAWMTPFGVPTTLLKTKSPESGFVIPLVDMYEEGGDLVVKADLPGIKKENIDISLSGTTLTISGERKTEETTEKKGYTSYERLEGSFCRTFELPVEVDVDKVKAHLDSGVLEIRLPKTAQVSGEGKKIEITS